MALLDILHFPNPLLRKKCNKITEVNKDLYRLADDMCETLDYHKGLGLAGNQVGYLKRIVVIKLPEENEFRVLINPEITKMEGRIESKEGCLSIPGFYEYVYRYEKIEIKAYDLTGKEVIYVPDGIQSVVFQHEFDHLDGILFPERMSQIKKDIFMKKINKEFK